MYRFLHLAQLYKQTSLIILNLLNFWFIVSWILKSKCLQFPLLLGQSFYLLFTNSLPCGGCSLYQNIVALGTFSELNAIHSAIHGDNTQQTCCGLCGVNGHQGCFCILFLVYIPPPVWEENTHSPGSYSRRGSQRQEYVGALVSPPDDAIAWLVTTHLPLRAVELLCPFLWSRWWLEQTSSCHW